MRDLFGVRISTGTIDAIYADAARRLTGFRNSRIRRRSSGDNPARSPASMSA